LGILPNSIDTRHYFCGRDDKGNIVCEGIYFKSETQSHSITIENKKNTPPQLQQIKNEKTEQRIKEPSKNLVKHEEKKDDKEAVYSTPPNSSQKIAVWTTSLAGAFLTSI
jgi:hypothetical protein